MPRLLRSLANTLEVDLKSESRNKVFYQSLRQLVTILFAVVLGVGLNELGDARGYDLYVLIVAYIAVILSWWGYHLATVAGPSETNILCYVIDCGLVMLYWFMIHNRMSLATVLWMYTIMFALYCLWEGIRSCKKRDTLSHKVRDALLLNFLFLFFVLILLASNHVRTLFVGPPSFLQGWFYMTALLLLMFPYRIAMHRIYTREEPREPRKEESEELLIRRAQEVAIKARAPLSGYKVGAAILSAAGKIYTGCNIEFENYSNTIHAEESAISAFVTAGESNPSCIAVFTFGDTVAFPCGMCRQSLFELGGENLRVIACNETGCETATIGELLPAGFRL